MTDRVTGWRSRDVVRATALIVGVVAGAFALWSASTIVFIVFLGVLFGLALGAGVDGLQRLRIPRGVGAPLLFLLALGALVGIGALTGPTLVSQSRELRSRVPEAIQQVQSWANTRLSGAIGDLTGDSTHAATATASSPRDTTARDSVRGDTLAHATTRSRHVSASAVSTVKGGASTPSLSSRFNSGLGEIVLRVMGFVGSTVEVVVYILLVFFVAVYVAADPGLYHDGLMHLVPHRHRRRAGDVLSAVAEALRQWLLAQFTAMVVLCVVWAIALSLLHVKAALALAVIAGLLEFIPTIGPTMAVVPALAMALVDSPAKALSVLICYLAIQAIEANVLIPLLMKGRIDLPPAVTIVAQALMTLAFGFLGLMVAVPICATVMVTIKLLYVEDVVGDAMPEVDRTLADARGG